VVTLVCFYGYLPFVDGILAHGIWTPFTRLTYNAYLVHPLFIKLVAGNAADYYYFEGMELAYHSLGNIAGAYAGAVVVWCLVEKPFATLTDVLVPKGRAERPPSKPAEGLLQTDSGTAAGCAPANHDHAG